MMATLLWKEYREQRGAWLAVALLSVVLVLGVGIFAQGGLLGLPRDELIRPVAYGIVFSLLFGHGVICGAMLLGGDRETGTLEFIDAHLGARVPLWQNKVAAGVVLVITQALWQAAVTLLAGLGIWQFLVLFPFLALEALAWGMLGAAYCRTVFPAVLIGVVLLLGSWLVSLVLIPQASLYLIAKFVAALAVVRVARNQFCQPDRARQVDNRPQRPPFSWRTLLWLTFSQNDRAVLIGVGAALALGAVVHQHPLLLWPPVSLLIGILCGLAAFGHEQIGRQEQFLGAQRFSPGQFWLVKIACCGAAALVLTALASGMALLLLFVVQANQVGVAWPEPWDWLGPFRRGVNPWWYLAVWPLHGFCFAQFCALLTRKTVIALVLASGLSVIVLMLWLPSLLAGGLSPWLMLPIPLSLLLASRLLMWPWMGGRLFTPQQILFATLGALACGIWLAGILAYRSIEIPDVGEPFDMRDLNARLDRAAASAAGRLLRQAAHGFQESRNQVLEEFTTPPRSNDIATQVLRHGWPKDDAEISRWLDRVMAGDWVEQVREAAELPLGLVVDPRLQRAADDAKKDPRQFVGLAEVFTLHSMKLQSRGDHAGALADIATTLGLARHLDNFSTLEQGGGDVENLACAALVSWLQRIPPCDKELLVQALDLVRQHDNERPDVLDRHRATYLARWHHQDVEHIDKYSKTQQALMKFVLQSPWEQQRWQRLQRAVMHEQLQPAHAGERDTLAAIRASSSFLELLPRLAQSDDERLTRVRAVQTQLAIALSRAETGPMKE